MPLYEFYCDACDKPFELMRRITDESQPVCPACGSSEVRRVVSQSSFVLKGTGWYVTDYGRKGAGGSEPKHGKGTPIPVDSASSEGTASSEGASHSEKSSGSEGTKKESGKSESSEGGSAKKPTQAAAQ